MARLLTKKCPFCAVALRRMYSRPITEGKPRYEPIGYYCPKCLNQMVEKDGIYIPDMPLCPECGSGYLMHTAGAGLRCHSCKKEFDLACKK